GECAMKLKALSLALAQTLLPNLMENGKSKNEISKRDRNSTISKKERKRRTKHKKAIKKQNAKGKK
ncbi:MULTISPECIES: hypothetical protein, partial [Helicobacter]|uniref:hypothetical protein n=2 Tax=Helicobacteraceae TaxID=72293 RepID=UPI00262696A6